MGFWIASIGMVCLIAGLFLRALLLVRPGQRAAEQDLQVYRDQLAEVERDLARQLIEPAEAERLRTEVARRVLEADRAVQAGMRAGAAPKAATLVMAGVMLVLLAASVLVYQRLGAPGYPDVPRAGRIADAEAYRASRPGQAAAELEMAGQPRPERPLDPAYAKLVEELRQKVAGRPDDLQGQLLLAQNEAGLGNFSAAAKAQDRVVALKGEQATSVDYATLADLLILAVNGYVSPEAEAALTESLRRDPSNPAARYYSGLMFAQTGRPDLAFRLWRPLLADSAADDPWVAPIRAQIEEIAALAGVDFTLPPEPGLKGPTGDQVAAAAEMTPEERAAMIGSMVEGLQARLSSEGGSGAEWARLIGAYGVLGEKAKAAAAWADAQQALTGKPDDLAAARAAAKEAGVDG